MKRNQKRSNEKGFFLVVHWACRAGTRDFTSALAAVVGSVQNIFPHHTLFQFLYVLSWADSRAGCRVSLSICVSDFRHPSICYENLIENNFYILGIHLDFIFAVFSELSICNFYRG